MLTGLGFENDRKGVQAVSDKQPTLAKLETDLKELTQRVEHVEASQAETETSIKQLQDQSRKQFEQLMQSITANKIAWASLSTGAKVIAWTIGTVIALAGIAIASWRGILEMIDSMVGRG